LWIHKRLKILRTITGRGLHIIIIRKGSIGWDPSDKKKFKYDRRLKDNKRTKYRR